MSVTLTMQNSRLWPSSQVMLNQDFKHCEKADTSLYPSPSLQLRSAQVKKMKPDNSSKLILKMLVLSNSVFKNSS